MSNIKQAVKGLKMPSGTVYTDTSARWAKYGGHAGRKSITRVLELAQSLGWKKKETKGYNSPDGSVVGHEVFYTDPTGQFQLSTDAHYGGTKESNSFSITVAPVKSPNA